jgi:lipooligosaccharide transport system ATP-binding protein
LDDFTPELIGHVRAEMSRAGASCGGSVDQVSAPVIAENLTKQFSASQKGGKPFTAVDGIDFVVEPGETFSILGPNGAGKSSTMKMVTTVSPVTSGSLTVLGQDPVANGPAIRQRMGVVPQEDLLDAELTVFENLVIYARYFGLSWHDARTKATELLEFASLTERRDDKVDPLSGGMKRRLTIARSLVNDPELVLLDEPTTGLDPQARHLLWERLYTLKEQGVSLLLTTHYMDEAEQLADRLVIMDDGRIVGEGSPSELIASHVTKQVLELRFPSADDGTRQRPDGLDQLGFRIESLPDRVLVYADDGEAALSAYVTAGIHPSGSLIRRSTLEDVFLAVTGRSLNE